MAQILFSEIGAQIGAQFLPNGVSFLGAELSGAQLGQALGAYAGAGWMVHYDGCHANDLGHRIVANRIFEVLAQNCSGLARWTKSQERAIPRWRDESCLKIGFADKSVGPGLLPGRKH